MPYTLTRKQRDALHAEAICRTVVGEIVPMIVCDAAEPLPEGW